MTLNKELSNNDLKADNLYAFGKNKTPSIYIGSKMEKVSFGNKSYYIHMFEFYLITTKEKAVINESMIPYNVFVL